MLVKKGGERRFRKGSPALSSIHHILSDFALNGDLRHFSLLATLDVTVPLIIKQPKESSPWRRL